MVQVEIELPKKLAEQLDTYLSNNPSDNMAAIVKEALRIREFPKDGRKILELAGVVKEASRGAAEHAEDFLG